MALDGPTHKPKPTPRVTSVKFEKKQEGATVGHTAAEAKLALVKLRTAAREAGSNLSEEVINASLDFQKYARPKIKEIEKAREAAAALTASLTSGLLSFAGSELAAKVTEGVARKIAEAIADGIKDNIVDRVKSAGADGDLDKVVDELTQGLRDWASGRKKAIEDVIVAHVDTLDAMLAGGKMPDFDDWTALAPLIEGENPDEYLALHYGVPSADRAKDIHLKLYRTLVLKFEEVHLPITYSHDEKAYAFADAHSLADQEMAIRADQMHKAETKHR